MTSCIHLYGQAQKDSFNKVENRLMTSCIHHLGQAQKDHFNKILEQNRDTIR